jgi:ATP-binding cassette subfamily F protein uup
VSHDRDFLDNVVTGTMVFEGDGRVAEYIGGYTDWKQQHDRAEAAKARQTAAQQTAGGNKGTGDSPAGLSGAGDPPADAPPRPAKPRKLTNKEQRELEDLPARIEALETEQGGLTARLASPDFYQREPGASVAVKARLDEIEQEFAAAFARWEELETRRNAAAG